MNENNKTRSLPEMLTAKELEALLKIDLKTIYGYVRDGRIPYVRIQSNIRFRKHQILEWIEQHTFSPRVISEANTNKPSWSIRPECAHRLHQSDSELHKAWSLVRTPC